jgi:hypothetical protein
VTATPTTAGTNTANVLAASSGLGSTVMNNTFHVNGYTAQQLAAQVGGIMMDQLKTRRMLGAA